MTKGLENKLKIKFRNKKLLKQALIHRSYLNENQDPSLASNERLEFLGDAVLELWTTKQLFDRFPGLHEGVLTNIRAALVRTENLAKAAQKINLGKFLFLSRGEDAGEGRKNPSLLANTFEALIGAIYLDQSWEETARFLNRHLLKQLIKLGRGGDVKDDKTKLQEIIQARLRVTPHYKTVKEEGPDHAKVFTVAAYYGKRKITLGKGNSKREAEEEAAKKALTLVRKKTKI